MSYDYTKSLLTKITRSASGKSQVYNLTYDAFGNMTRMAVGSRTLMTYEYGGKEWPSDESDLRQRSQHQLPV